MGFLIRGQQYGKIFLYSGQSSSNSKKNIGEELAVNMIGSNDGDEGGGDGCSGREAAFFCFGLS